MLRLHPVLFVTLAVICCLTLCSCGKNQAAPRVTCPAVLFDQFNLEKRNDNQTLVLKPGVPFRIWLKFDKTFTLLSASPTEETFTCDDKKIDFKVYTPVRIEAPGTSADRLYVIGAVGQDFFGHKLEYHATFRDDEAKIVKKIYYAFYLEP